MQKDKYTFFTQNGIFGLLIGISFIAVSFVYYTTGQSVSVNPQLNSVTMLLSITGAFIGCRKYREDCLNGIISYGKALITCIYLIFIAAILYGIYIAILYHYDPSSQTAYFAMLEQTGVMFEKIYATSPLSGEIENALQMLKTPFAIAFSVTFDKIFMGTIFSLFLAGMLRKSEKRF